MNRPSLIAQAAALALCACAATTAQAQYTSGAAGVGMPTASSSGFEASGIPSSGTFSPKSVRLGDSAISLTPILGMSLGFNDNMRLSPNNELESSFVTLSPKLLANAAYGVSRYSFGYQADLVRYQSSSRDNVENQELAATGLHDLDTRFALNWRASYQNRFDGVGTTDRALSSGPDRWHGKTLVLAGRYGAQDAQGRIEAEVGWFDKKYVNNRINTAGADYSSTNLMGRFITRVAPKTSLGVEYRHTQFDYVLDTASLDNTEQRLLLGVQWDATAATSGVFKVGYLNKEYDRVRPSYSGSTWEGGLRWSPRTYSKFDLNLGRSATDPSGTAASFLVTSSTSLRWTHDWRTYFSTNVNFSRNGTNYEGTGRRDKTNTYGIGLSYDLLRWLRASAELSHSERDSNDNNFDYDRNLLNFQIEVSF